MGRAELSRAYSHVLYIVCTARVVQDEEDTPTVTFPDDYPNSVRHFLLIGFLGMFIGAIVFFYMGISRKVNTVMHVLTFFIAAVSACAYYAEWAGLGVEYKTTDTTPRVIFWAHYLDWVVTGPVSQSISVLMSAVRGHVRRLDGIGSAGDTVAGMQVDVDGFAEERSSICIGSFHSSMQDGGRHQDQGGW